MRRAGWFVLAVIGALGTAWGQGRAPGGASESGPLVRDDARTFFPMVQEATFQSYIRPANPKRSEVRAVRPNRLRSGGRRTALRPRDRALFPGIEYNGSRPPDPHIAVGTDQIVQVTNSQIAVFDRAGQRLFLQTLGPSGFFRGVATRSFVFDPRVVYDAMAGRFYVVALEFDDAPEVSGLLVAASDGPDPLGGWSKWRIESRLWRDGRSFWFDYPSLGFSRDGVVVTGNLFPFAGGTPWARSIGFRKAALSGGGPLPFFFWTHERTPTVQASRALPGAGDTVFGAALSTTSALRLLAWAGFATGVPRLNEAEVVVPSFTLFTARVPTSDGATIDPVSDRLMDAAWGGGSLYATHTVQVSRTDPRASVRWYEFTLGSWPESGSPGLRQTGEVRADGNGHYCMPAIAVDSRASVSLVMTGSSRTTLPDLFATGRTASAPNGAMGTPTRIGSSLQRPIDASSRWGDYFSVVPDPVDTGVFWGTGQVTRADGDWSTVIVNWTLP